MIEIWLLSMAVWMGVDMKRIVALATATWVPMAGAIALALMWWRHRSAATPNAARFCEAVAAEVRSGSSLRQAISAGARSAECPALALVADSGHDLASIAEAASAHFPDIGVELKACIARSSALGAPVAELFDEIGSLALAQLDVAREVNSAMAPARATVLLLMAAPVTAFWWAARSGDLARFLALPAQRLAILVGGSLSLVAVLIGMAMMRRPV